MKILIVEDHPMMREQVRQICVQGVSDEVVGEAETRAEGLRLAGLLKPDLVILDLGLPDGDGLVVVREMMSLSPATRILVLSGLLDDFTVYSVERSGVHGFLDKSTNTADMLRRALDVMAVGRRYFSPAFEAKRLARRKDTRSFDKLLSETELTVLALAGEGLNDREIGARLGIAPATAQTHRRNILRKLGLKGSVKLVGYTMEKGFTRWPSRSPFPSVKET